MLTKDKVTQCNSCQKWIHNKCSGIKGSMSKVMKSLIMTDGLDSCSPCRKQLHTSLLLRRRGRRTLPVQNGSQHDHQHPVYGVMSRCPHRTALHGLVQVDTATGCIERRSPFSQQPDEMLAGILCLFLAGRRPST